MEPKYTEDYRSLMLAAAREYSKDRSVKKLANVVREKLAEIYDQASISGIYDLEDWVEKARKESRGITEIDTLIYDQIKKYCKYRVRKFGRSRYWLFQDSGYGNLKWVLGLFGGFAIGWIAQAIKGCP